jgi:hypothetical protein
MDAERTRSSASAVITGRTRDGEAISEFKSAGGRTVRVRNSDVYRKATAAAGRKLREITDKKAK